MSKLPLTKKDFQTDQEVRWCPGCGDYAILAQVQKVFPTLGIPKEQFVIVSGIGCSSRFPYYMNTYGFHTIHGRAPAVATGLKVMRPELSVWVVTGDGDGLSIGGNHFLHVMRRNVDLKMMLFNNRIYGLTKGQYSPTSELGKKTKSTPLGSLDYPFCPGAVAIAAEASFVARALDRDQKHLGHMVERAARHTGTAFLEIYQNCNVFNDGAFFDLTEKDTRPINVLEVEHGKPLVFGPNKEHGIVFDGFEPKVVDVAEVGLDKIVVHDEQGPAAYHAALVRMRHPSVIGVVRAVPRPPYDAMMNQQIDQQIAQRGAGDLQALLRGRDTWVVEE